MKINKIGRKIKLKDDNLLSVLRFMAIAVSFMIVVGVLTYIYAPTNITLETEDCTITSVKDVESGILQNTYVYETSCGDIISNDYHRTKEVITRFK